ncbi:copper amine oxidase N-terminal domain-containing protein [Coprothermobacteraceae bacterium]|nr:copper amine oxidase N-terminal domain-containing protein [Coprothermobacteraceae bacterium]
MRKLVAGLLAVFLLLSPAVVRAESGTSGTVQVTVRAIREDGSPMSGRLRVVDAITEKNVTEVWVQDGEGGVAIQGGRYHFVFWGKDAEGKMSYFLEKAFVSIEGSQQEVVFDVRQMPTGTVLIGQVGFDSMMLIIDSGRMRGYWADTGTLTFSPGSYTLSISFVKQTKSDRWQYTYKERLNVEAGRTYDLGTYSDLLRVDLGAVRERYMVGESIPLTEFVKDAAGHILTSIFDTTASDPLVKPQVSITAPNGSEIWTASGWALDLPLTHSPGLYLLTVSLNAGPGLGVITATKSFELAQSEHSTLVTVRAIREDGSLMSGWLFVLDAGTGSVVTRLYEFSGAGTLALNEGKYHFVLRAQDALENRTYLLIHRNVVVGSAVTEVIFDVRQMPTGSVVVQQGGFDKVYVDASTENTDLRLTLSTKSIVSTGTYTFFFRGQKDTGGESWQYEFGAGMRVVQQGQLLDLGSFGGTLNMDLSGVRGKYNVGEPLDLDLTHGYVKDVYGHALTGVYKWQDFAYFGRGAGVEVRDADGRLVFLELHSDTKLNCPEGIYTLKVEVDTGPYQGVISATRQLEVRQLRIDASAGSGGTISPAGTIPLVHGSSQTFTITPDPGYRVAGVLVDGKSVGATTSYTFTNVTENHKIYAAFEKAETTISLQIGDRAFFVDGVTQFLDSRPVIKNGRTLLPIRAIVEALGGQVGWDANQKKVTVTLGSNRVELWIGKNTALVNGRQVMIDATNPKVVPEIINGRTMLPLRFVAESLGCSVEWDGNTQTVRVTYKRP